MSKFKNINDSNKNKIIQEAKPNVFYFYILTLYLILSIVNWLPIIDNNVVRIIKYFIFIYILIYEFSLFGFRYPSNYLSLKGLLFLFISMLPGLALSFDFTAIVDILIPFLIIWSFNYKKQFYFRVIFNATVIVAVISFFSAISYYFDIFNIEANGPWNSTFGQAGFGGYRTGYSNSLFLFIPFIVFWHRTKRKKIISYESLLILIILVAQYISGGRAGLLSSLIVVLIWVRISIISKGLLIAVFLFIFQLDSVQQQLRMNNYRGEDQTIDEISSGRIFLNTYYFEKYFEEPLFGYGFGDKPSVIIYNTEAHIVWLRNVIDGGIFYLILLFYIFIEIYRKITGNYVLTVEEKKLFYSLFFTTIVITFLEPNYLIGSVQGEVIYWILISLLLKRHNPILPVKKKMNSEMQ